MSSTKNSTFSSAVALGPAVQGSVSIKKSLEVVIQGFVKSSRVHTIKCAHIFSETFSAKNCSILAYNAFEMFTLRSLATLLFLIIDP